MNPGATNTIFDHFDEFFDQKFGVPTKIKSFKFTIRYADGSKAEPTIKAENWEKAREALNYWFPGYDIELGCKEL